MTDAPREIIVTMADTAPGREVDAVLGVVAGSIVRARFFGRDFIAGLRNLVGGEVTEYTQLLSESRSQAMERMVAEAERLGADAVVTFRFSTSTVMEGSAEILAYGTAVKLK
jgi:uncharacterized protein YbjQ (UPF0145 family)